jgi:apolipoprotein D and lipocalin family protein
VWWVLWADVGYRTLAIGTPSGRFGFILNRGGDLPADRMRAAREVLEWNGYGIGRLR